VKYADARRYRRLAVHTIALPPISTRKMWTSLARATSFSTATGQKIWLDDRSLYVAVFVSDAAIAALLLHFAAHKMQPMYGQPLRLMVL